MAQGSQFAIFFFQTSSVSKQTNGRRNETILKQIITIDFIKLLEFFQQI